jgi:putative ABC transport system permease protein
MKMLKNYIKIAWRQIIKSKGYSFINISGLAIGISCTLLIILWIQDELNFDHHHQHADRIYRVGVQFGPSVDDRGAYTTPPMAKAMKDEFPEIQHIVRLSLWPSNSLVTYKEKQFLEKGIIEADTTIFDVFTLPLLKGNPKTALKEPRTLVISEDYARKYFGDEDPMSKLISIDKQKEKYKITGVVRNCPYHSHFQYDIIVSLPTYEISRSDSWGSHTFFTYLVLKQGIQSWQLESKFPEFVKKYYGAYFYKDTGKRYEDYLKEGNHYYGFWLQPLKEIYLDAGIHDNLPRKGNTTYLYVFTIIALFILILACINYMNLATAKSFHRAREIGLYKVVGSSKSQIVRQFLTESVLITIVASSLGLVLVLALLPAFNEFTGKQISSGILFNSMILVCLLGSILFVGLGAGSYPAIYLASLQPIKALRKNLKTGTKGNRLRSALVILQFIVSIVIILGTFIIHKQMSYLRRSNLGFDQEHVVVIHRATALGNQREAFKQALLQHPTIKAVSHTNSLPGRHFDPNGHRLEGRPKSEEYILHTMYGDEDFMKLLNLKIVKGRYFSKEIPTDSTSSVVINQKAVKELGLTDPLGKRFIKEFGDAKKGEFVTIIGVLKDFNYHSLHHAIYPMIIRPLPKNRGFFTSVRITPHNIERTLNSIKECWDKFSNHQPFEYSFLDEDFNNLYKKEQKVGQIFTAFSIVAMIIACLGLLGLISHTVEQRTREIGIRKVVGASETRILLLLSKDFTKWILIANLIAWPLAYIIFNNWMRSFAYRIHLGIETFLLAGVSTLFLALTTISYQSLKAALTNPVDVLKHE